MVKKLCLKNIYDDEYVKPAYKLELDGVDIASNVSSLTLKIEPGCLPELILRVSHIRDIDIDLSNVFVKDEDRLLHKCETCIHYNLFKGSDFGANSYRMYCDDLFASEKCFMQGVECDRYEQWKNTT